jgi:periplasmic divalent cation tolerance protein
VLFASGSTTPTRVVEVRTRLEDEAQAAEIARLVVEERLAACAHLRGPIRSTYRWQGVVESALEFEIDAVTTADQVGRLVARFEELHPYVQPAVLVTEALATASYGQWVADQTSS